MVISLIGKQKGGQPVDSNLVIQLVNEYGDQLYRYAYHMTRDEEDAQDIIQEVFLKVLRLKRLDGIENISAYLYSITYNCTVDFIKGKNRRRFIKLFSHGTSKSAEKEYLDENVNSIIKEALNQLSYEDRTVFLLRNLEDMEYSTISSIMNIKEATLRKKYERSRKKIRKYLQDKEAFKSETREEYIERLRKKAEKEDSRFAYEPCKMLDEVSILTLQYSDENNNIFELSIQNLDDLGYKETSSEFDPDNIKELKVGSIDVILEQNPYANARFVIDNNRYYLYSLSRGSEEDIIKLIEALDNTL